MHGRIWGIFLIGTMEIYPQNCDGKILAKKISISQHSCSSIFHPHTKWTKMFVRKKNFYNHVFLRPSFSYINIGIMIYWDNETAMFKKSTTQMAWKRDFLCSLCRKLKSLKIESFVCLSRAHSISKAKNSLNSTRGGKKSRFLVYYTHIWCAHMRWWWWCERIRKRRHFWTWTLPESWSLAPARKKRI